MAQIITTATISVRSKPSSTGRSRCQKLDVRRRRSFRVRFLAWASASIAKAARFGGGGAPATATAPGACVGRRAAAAAAARAGTGGAGRGRGAFGGARLRSAAGNALEGGRRASRRGRGAAAGDAACRRVVGARRMVGAQADVRRQRDRHGRPSWAGRAMPAWTDAMSSSVGIDALDPVVHHAARDGARVLGAEARDVLDHHARWRWSAGRRARRR